MNLIDMKKQ